MRDFQLPGRSAVRTTGAMAATSHPPSTEAALNMLRQGGNAVDAASAVQAVVEPQSTGIGGDCFVLYTKAGSDRVFALNGSGRAPLAASIEAFRALGLTAVPSHGPHSVTIPGAIDAWGRLSRDHGRKPLADCLAEAIRYAEAGNVVHDRVACDWAETADLLAADPHSAAIFLPEGIPLRGGRPAPPAGVGRDAAPGGCTGAGRVLQGTGGPGDGGAAARTGGLLRLADFAATRCDWVEPVSVDYRGYRIHQMPQNNQGLTALLMLNTLARRDLAALDPHGAQPYHLEVEAARLAYRERNTRLAEMARDNPVSSSLLSPRHAAKLNAEIDPNRAMTHLPSVELTMSDTVYISIVDEDRNAISFINSTYWVFGSGITCPETGVVLQNRGASFRMEQGHPNALAPGKRPMHTIMPGMVTRGGQAIWIDWERGTLTGGSDPRKDGMAAGY